MSVASMSTLSRDRAIVICSLCVTLQFFDLGPMQGVRLNHLYESNLGQIHYHFVRRRIENCIFAGFANIALHLPFYQIEKDTMQIQQSHFGLSFCVRFRAVLMLNIANNVTVTNCFYAQQHNSEIQSGQCHLLLLEAEFLLIIM